MSARVSRTATTRKPSPMTDGITEPSKEPTKAERSIDKLLGRNSDKDLPNVIVFVAQVTNSRKDDLDFKFRYPADTDDWDSFERGGKDFLEKMTVSVDELWSKGKTNLSPQFIDALGNNPKLGRGKPTPQDLANAYTINYWSHPDDKIDQVQAILMTRKYPLLCKTMLNFVYEKMSDYHSAVCFSGIVDKKKD